MKSRLTISGDELSLSTELTLEQLQKVIEALDLDTSSENMTGWEKPNDNEQFYYVTHFGRIEKMKADESNEDDINHLYDNVNCYKSAVLARNIQRGEKLVRELRRFAVEKRKEPLDFSENGGYTIIYNYQTKCLEIGASGSWRGVGDVIFDTEDTALAAKTQFFEELIWYFTERKDRI